jgi:hypothetical protein
MLRFQTALIFLKDLNKTDFFFEITKQNCDVLMSLFNEFIIYKDQFGRAPRAVYRLNPGEALPNSFLLRSDSLLIL